MFAIPAGMLMGASVGVLQWWLWNQIPVTVGNVVGGMLFTGMALHLAHRKRRAPAVEVTVPAAIQGQMVAGR